ncbi:hypothetical protein TNIN_72051 [Trichonephila inaurata madagascariensis]|uniref:Uncharacterized protein n=1 Tax=Trichonephila inaurata madagascariensis TaxID=2747483 RepID=A0A8X6WM30_9ARAC|nr:hypothetical protein TNIN_72051 [Trichonephila inaurata madagascariensis]
MRRPVHVSYWLRGVVDLRPPFSLSLRHVEKHTVEKGKSWKEGVISLTRTRRSKTKPKEKKEGKTWRRRVTWDEDGSSTVVRLLTSVEQSYD